jgi:creatinine amidohydrolase
MEKVKYAEMLPHEIVARRKEFPAAFVGLGILEFHGEHDAVGLDALKAEKLCELAAAKSGGFAFPALWYGEPRVYKLLEFDHDDTGEVKAKMQFNKDKFSPTYYGKTGEEQVKFYQDLLYHLLIQMNTLEMRAVCLLTGHYPLSKFAQPVVERFNSNFRDTQAFAGTEAEYPPPSEFVGGDHAAKWETSYLGYLRPDCVDMCVYLGRENEPLVGVIGTDPRKEASVEIGRRACNLIVDAMVEKAEELIKCTRGAIPTSARQASS